MLASPRSYEEIVEQYRVEHRGRAVDERRYFKRHKSLTQAIRNAALALGPEGRRYSHQWLVPQRALEAAAIALLGVQEQVASAPTFSELFRVVERTIAPIHGIGPLAVYDTALRIGAFRQLEPDCVYLHAGVLEGAKALGRHERQTLQMSDLPKAFHKLRPSEVEDVLCIFRAAIRAINSGKPGTTADNCGPRVSRARHKGFRANRC